MSRNRLAVSKLPDLIAWAEGQGWVSEPPKGIYEAARLRHTGRLAIFWQRDSNDNGGALTHLTMDRAGDNLFSQWLKSRE